MTNQHYSGVSFSAGLDWMYHGGETTTYYAVFQPIAYRCLYYADIGGTVNGSSTRYDVYVSLLTDYATEEILAVPEQGYVFSGWSDGRNDNPRIDVLDPDEPQGVEVVAYFSRGYSLTYTAGEGGSIQGATIQSVPAGGSGTTVTAVADEGWRFVRWSDGVDNAQRTDADVSGNISIIAEFESDPDWSPFAGGDGSAESPYQIENAAQLYAVGSYPSAHFVLTDDITLPKVGMDSGNISPLCSDENPFLGNFDGAGHKIIDMSVYNTQTFYSGLFAVIGSAGSVENVTFENASVRGTNYAGIVAGYSLGSIANCTVEGTLTYICANDYKVFFGGVAGHAEGVVADCSADATLTVNGAGGETYVGGIVGYSAVSSSAQAPLTLSSRGTISAETASDLYVGGIVGYATSDLYFESCFSDAALSAESNGSAYTGGLIGYGRSDINVTDSYATGDVTSTADNSSYAGGLIGYTGGSLTIQNSYTVALINAKGADVYAGGLAGYVSSKVTLQNAHWLRSAESDAEYAVGYNVDLGVPTGIDSTAHSAVEEFYSLADALNTGRETPVWEHKEENSLPTLMVKTDETTA